MRSPHGGARRPMPDASKPGEDASAIRRLLPFLLAYKGRVALAMALLVAAKLANVALPVVLKFIVDALDAKPELAVTVPLGFLLLYGLLRLSSTLLGELRDLVFGRVTERAMHQAALTVFKHLHKLDLSFHLDRRTGGLSRDIERGISGISFLLRFMLFNILPTLLEIGLVAGILMFAYGWGYAAIVLAAVVLYIGFSVVATEWRTTFVRKANELDSKANTRAIDSLLNFETVKYFGNERFEAERYDRSLSAWEIALAQNRLSLVSLNAGQAVIIAISATAMLILAASDVVSGAMTLGDLVLINAYILQLFMPLNFLGFVYREIKRSLADMGRMFRLLDRQPAIADAPDAKPLSVTDAAVRFDNVQFGYHPERPILKGVSFDIPAGQTIAVVGPSGAGKSTLARLLYRFYDIDGGGISIDGQDLRSISQDSLRAAIGIVPQDTVLFNDSIYYNLEYGRPGASREDIERAASMAHLDGFIASLPEGFDTTVGERGLKLSGGEKQRLAIARAILKNPAVMIFDEATSSLDSASERAILGALNEVAEQRSTLVIAHRLSTITHADRILVLQDGQIVESGRHVELLEKSGLYAQLWEMQQHEKELAPEA